MNPNNIKDQNSISTFTEKDIQEELLSYKDRSLWAISIWYSFLKDFKDTMLDLVRPIEAGDITEALAKERQRLLANLPEAANNTQEKKEAA